MKVTVCQLDPRDESRDAHIAFLAEHIQANKSDFLLLPEMCFSPWLAAEQIPDSKKWQAAVLQHQAYIDRLTEFGVDGVLGTRPTSGTGERGHNAAYLWDRASGEATNVHQKYYLPNEPGYWEAEWYDRGDKSFDTVGFADLNIGIQICIGCISKNGSKIQISEYKYMMRRNGNIVRCLCLFVQQGGRGGSPFEDVMNVLTSSMII